MREKNPELKFRAWDCYKKRMFAVHGLQLTPIGTWAVWDGNVLIQPCNIGSIMQCTGLKDKNGKMIFEGDILTGKKISHPYQVIFSYGSFNINWPNCCAHCKAGNATHGTLYELLATDETVEVIGNIYENPELLETQK